VEPVNHEAMQLAVHLLLGADILMTGQVVAQGGARRRITYCH